MAGLTPAGLEIRTQPEVLARIEANLKAALPGVNIQAGPLHQLAGIVSEEVAIVWEALQALYAASDRSSAVGRSLDRIGALTGTLRRAATRSTVVGTARLGAATTLPAGSLAAVSGEPDRRFRTMEAVTNPTTAAADIGVRFEALETGPIAAPAGTLTVIVAPVPGWVSITNPLDAELGQDVERAPEYRRRQVAELSASGGGRVDAIRSALLRLSGVRAARVFENIFEIPNAEGMPPHSVEAVVLGGDDDAIARRLWAKGKAAGIQPHGSVAATVEDSTGDPHILRFSRPVERPVAVSLNLRVDADKFPSDGIARTQNRIAELGDRWFGVGDDVIRTRFYCFATNPDTQRTDIEGVVDIDPLLLAFTPGVLGPSNLIVGSRELATFDSSRVTVITTPV